MCVQAVRELKNICIFLKNWSLWNVWGILSHGVMSLRHWGGDVGGGWGPCSKKWGLWAVWIIVSLGVFLVAQTEKNLPVIQETQEQSLGLENPLEKEMATHSGIPAWRIHMDRGAWWATVHEVTELDTTEWLKCSLSHWVCSTVWCLGGGSISVPQRLRLLSFFRMFGNGTVIMNYFLVKVKEMRSFSCLRIWAVWRVWGILVLLGVCSMP